MVDPIRGCNETNQHDLASCRLSNTLCSVWVSGTQTFPMSKLCGLMYTTAFHNSSDTNRYHTLKHLRPYWYYETGRKLATEEDGESFGMRMTLACLRQDGKNYPDEQATETLTTRLAGQNISSLKKMMKHTPWVSSTTRVQSNKRRLTSLDLKAKVGWLGDGVQVSCRSTDSQDCWLSKWSDSRSALRIHSDTSPPPPPISIGSDELSRTPQT